MILKTFVRIWSQSLHDIEISPAPAAGPGGAGRRRGWLLSLARPGVPKGRGAPGDALRQPYPDRELAEAVREI
jgi:hypothetical protein